MSSIASKQALGIVVQFAQTSSGTEPHRWKPPATVENPPSPVTVVGLRMRVSAADRAREQLVCERYLGPVVHFTKGRRHAETRRQSA